MRLLFTGRGWRRLPPPTRASSATRRSTGSWTMSGSAHVALAPARSRRPLAPSRLPSPPGRMCSALRCSPLLFSSPADWSKGSLALQPCARLSPSSAGSVAGTIKIVVGAGAGAGAGVGVGVGVVEPLPPRRPMPLVCADLFLPRSFRVGATCFGEGPRRRDTASDVAMKGGYSEPNGLPELSGRRR